MERIWRRQERLGSIRETDESELTAVSNREIRQHLTGAEAVPERSHRADGSRSGGDVGSASWWRF